MENEEIMLFNICTDLVGLKQNEAFPSHLLGDHGAGEWVGVLELCQQQGLNGAVLKPDLFATWLADPLAHADYVVILFYDDESKWSMAAHFNKRRLFEMAGAKGALPTSMAAGRSRGA